MVSRYIISYMPCDQSWKSPITEEAETNEFNDLNLPGGNIYGVNVRAKNKAGVSPPSNEVEINLGMSQLILLIQFSSLLLFHQSQL